jgi:hypothetical protein
VSTISSSEEFLSKFCRDVGQAIWPFLANSPLMAAAKGTGPQSLGDEITMGGGGSTDDTPAMG